MTATINAHAMDLGTVGGVDKRPATADPGDDMNKRHRNKCGI